MKIESFFCDFCKRKFDKALLTGIKLEYSNYHGSQGGSIKREDVCSNCQTILIKQYEETIDVLGKLEEKG